MKKGLFILIFSVFQLAFSQQVKILNLDQSEVSYRGLSVIDDYSLWVSGTKGTIGFTLNGGKTFFWVNPKGFEDRDFRGIENLNHQTALAIAIGSPALILKTKDQGKTWKVVYEDDHPDAFLDAIQFNPYNFNLGYVLGDPIGNEPYILETKDAGESWQKINPSELPKMSSGEAYFAASNSNLFIMDESAFLSVTGGSNSKLLVHSTPLKTLVLPKSPSIMAGANAVDYRHFSDFGLVAGGDFENPESFENNLFIFELRKSEFPTLTLPEVSPRGYKSGVAIINDNIAISCGLLGVDLSVDKGKKWKNISETPYHSCKKAGKGSNVYLVGPQGRIGKYFD